MGCEYSKDDLETRMLMLKIKRVAIRQKRQKIIEKLEKLTGEKIIIEPISYYLEDDKKDNKKNEKKENIFKKNKDYEIGDD